MDHISLTMYNYVYEVLVWLEGQQRDQAAIMPSTILRQTLPGLRHEHQTWPMLRDIHPLEKGPPFSHSAMSFFIFLEYCDILP